MNGTDVPREASVRRFDTPAGVALTADVLGPEDGPPAVLMHGGGQTRYAWGSTAQALAEAGWRAYNVDLRGHGESDWHPDGRYGFDEYVADLKSIVARLDEPPVLIGASLGGLTAMLAEGEGEEPLARALVLVDVVPRMSRQGTQRIIDFMRAYSGGFASLEEAADAIAEYRRHRSRPSDLSGLHKNLRRGEDGRYYWHWDPRMLQQGNLSQPDILERLDAAASRIRVPTLLVRGRESDVVGEEGVRHFLDLVPHARFHDVAEAGHMVAGDNNEAFAEAILAFLRAERRGGERLQ